MIKVTRKEIERKRQRLERSKIRRRNTEEEKKVNFNKKKWYLKIWRKILSQSVQNKGAISSFQVKAASLFQQLFNI